MSITSGLMEALSQLSQQQHAKFVRVSAPIMGSSGPLSELDSSFLQRMSDDGPYGSTSNTFADGALLQYLSQEAPQLLQNDAFATLQSLRFPGGGFAREGSHLSMGMDMNSALDPGSQGGSPTAASRVVPQLPNSITVMPSTDTTQAAGLINFTLSQPGASNFVLYTAPSDSQGSSVSSINAALKVAVRARKINQQARSKHDLGVVPFMANDASSSIGLLVNRYQPPMQMFQSRGQLLRIEADSNPLLAGLSLCNVILSTGSHMEMVFTPAAARVALQALAIGRVNLTNHGQDVMLLPHLVDSHVGLNNASSYYHVRIIPTHQVLPCFQHQFKVQDQQHQQQQAQQHQQLAGTIDEANGIQAVDLQHSHSPTMPSFARTSSSEAALQRSASPVQPFLHTSSAELALQRSASPPGLGSRTASGNLSASFGLNGAYSSSSQLQQQGQHGQLVGAAAVMAAAAAAPKPRARKADYVIVTEDTAIKNAAGAIAKVLGRVSGQGQCCPVFTEKKTDVYTTVVSVAVKAIAVARGYVCNEGTGHEVGFQPYIRVADKQMDVLDLHQYLLEKKMLAQLNKGGNLAAVTKSIEKLDASADDDSVIDERTEMAFDVFKVPILSEQADAGNLPVKVTAHSRSNVVSNIISKLVSERDAAVLITAGGKAMHVAMTAVVSARARLKARGTDIILLPKFVTVDTTSTLGWESVFLRFHIVRWASAAGSGDEQQQQAQQQQLLVGPVVGPGDTGSGGSSSSGNSSRFVVPP